MDTVLETLQETETKAEKEARIEYLEQVKRAEITRIKALEKYINVLKRQEEDSCS